MSRCGRFVCIINPGLPIELNLDSEGGIHIQLPGLNHRVFLADQNEDRHREEEGGVWEDLWTLSVWPGGEENPGDCSQLLCGCIPNI